MVFVAAVVAATMVLPLFVGTAEAGSEKSIVLNYPQKNLFIFTTVSDFERGEQDGTEVVGAGNGAVTLKKGVTYGTYTSPEIETEPFEYMILSWDADTPEGTYVEIQGRVHVWGQWSKWLSWGRWSTSAFTDADGNTALPGSAPLSMRDDSIARVATDELYVKGSSGQTADKFQYRLILHGQDDKTGDPKRAPKVYLVACTIKNTLPRQSIPKVYPEGAPDLSHLDMDLDVPTYSQYMRDSRIANSICSPTSMAMLLGYRGIDISPEECAWGVRDYQAGIFGNWSFNTAYVASYGLVAYVDYMVPAQGADPWYSVKKEISEGNPVVVSVKYRKPGYTGSSYPEVEGVPINSTGGHLVLIRGFTWVGGTEYVIVNDPAAPSNDEVRRLYRADQFFSAWTSKVAYVVYVNKDEIHQPSRPQPIMGKLIPAGDPENGYQKYQLVVDKETINLSAANIRSIVVSYNREKTTPIIPRSSDAESPDLLWFDCSSAPGKYTFWFMDVNKNTYQADIYWKK